MQDLRPRYIAQIAQYFYKVFYIMPVYRPEITELQGFKKVTSFQQGTFNAFFDLFGDLEGIGPH